MNVSISGNRVSSQNSRRADVASPQELPELSDEQKLVASKLGVKQEDYARQLYAWGLEEKDLDAKARRAGHLIERLARGNFPGLHVQLVWLNTFDEKFRFDMVPRGQDSVTVLLDEEMVDRVLQSGSASAEHEIARVLDYNLPEAWGIQNAEAQP